jgi:hypothetical protein
VSTAGSARRQADPGAESTTTVTTTATTIGSRRRPPGTFHAGPIHAASVIAPPEKRKVAVEVATQAIGLAGSLKSRRYLRYVGDLCADLTSFAGEAEVRTFNDLVIEKYPTILVR